MRPPQHFVAPLPHIPMARGGDRVPTRFTPQRYQRAWCVQRYVARLASLQLLGRWAADRPAEHRPPDDRRNAPRAQTGRGPLDSRRQSERGTEHLEGSILGGGQTADAPAIPAIAREQAD